jgi:hypothetical protein
LNGIAPSWADVAVSVTPSGASLIKTNQIKSLNSSRKVDVGLQKQGGRVFKRTTGESTQEGTIVFYRDGYDELIREFVKIAPKRGNECLISLVYFTVQVLHTPPGSTKIYERIWEGVRIVGDTMNGAEGTDAQEVEVPVSIIQIADMVDGQKVVLL